MTLTPLTSAGSYLPTAAMLSRYDWRSIGDLCSDNDVRIPQATLLGNGVISGNANFQAALIDASGMVEEACILGERYQPADLLALPAGSAGQGALYRLVADIAIGLINQRRPDKSKGVPPQYEAALKMLDALADGKRIFPFLETAKAGIIDHKVESARDVAARNQVTWQANRFFGTRSNMLGPPGRSIL